MDIKILKRSVPIDDRTEKLVETSRSEYLQEDYGRSWSSQEWKSGAVEHDRSGKPEENSSCRISFWEECAFCKVGETIHDRTGQLVSENLQEQAHFENFIMESDVTEFVNQVRNQVRIRQRRMSSIAENCTEHSIIW